MTDLELATGLVLGTLESDERARARIRAVEDLAFAGTVAKWENRLAPLAVGEAEPLPPGLFEKIETGIGPSGVQLPGTFTLRGGGGEWAERSAGLRMSMLNEHRSYGGR